MAIYLRKLKRGDMRNKCPSPFKIQKNGVFRFEISFFVLEISTFFYYANLISDDVILCATKMWKTLNKRYLILPFLSD